MVFHETNVVIVRCVIHCLRMWAREPVGGLLAANVGRLSQSVGLTGPRLAENLGPMERCLWVGTGLLVGRYT
jgi:hypothetical protein